MGIVDANWVTGSTLGIFYLSFLLAEAGVRDFLLLQVMFPGGERIKVSDVWISTMALRNDRSPVERLHFAMLLCQTILHWRTAAMILKSLEGDFLNPLRTSHAAAVKELHRYSLEAPGRILASLL